MNPTDATMISGAIIAIVEAVKTRFPQVQNAWTPLLCAVLGLAAGFLHLGGLDVVQGGMLGLASAGVHTVATVLGSSTPTTTQSNNVGSATNTTL